MIGENPEQVERIPRKSRVESPIDRIDMVARLSRISAQKKGRPRRVSQVTSASQFSTQSSYGSSRSRSTQELTSPSMPIESLQLGVDTLPDPKRKPGIPVRLAFSKTRSFGAAEGDLDSLLEPNASLPIMAPSLSRSRFGHSTSSLRVGPSASRPRLGKSLSKASLPRSKTQLVSISKTRLGAKKDGTSKTHLAGTSKTHLAGTSKTRIVSSSKTRVSHASKTNLRGTSKTRLGGTSKTRLDGAAKPHIPSKTRMTSKTRLAESSSKVNLYEVQGSLAHAVQATSALKSALRVAPSKLHKAVSLTSAYTAEDIIKHSAGQTLGQVSVTPSQAAALAQARNKSQSWNAVPKNVEQILYEHPYVLEAMIVGSPRDQFPVVLVVLREGCQAREQDLIDFINARVGRNQRLRTSLKIMKRLPRRRTGSIKKVNIMY